jgi:hypothetical protein
MLTFAAMKTKLFAAIILSISTISTATAQPEITWLQTDHDFGTINEDLGSVTCTYQYVNTGDQDLAIASARATCGCTTPRFDETPLAPGDTASITVSFSPIGRLGRFDKKVYVETNAEPSRSVLTLHGTVIGGAATVAQRYPADLGALKFRNGSIMIGDVTKGKLKTIFAEAYNPGPDTLRPHILTTPQYITAQPTPETVAPGEQISFILHLHSEKCPQWGLLEDSLTIIPDPQLAPTPITIPLTATILEDFSQLTNAQLKKAPQAVIQDDTLDFGQITANSPYTKTRTTTITNRGHSDLTIRRAYTLVPGVNISIDKQKLRAGQTTQLTVTINPSQLTAPILNDKITLITNSPENPQQTIRIIGLIQ